MVFVNFLFVFMFFRVLKTNQKKTPCHFVRWTPFNLLILTEMYKLASLKQFKISSDNFSDAHQKTMGNLSIQLVDIFQSGNDPVFS